MTMRSYVLAFDTANEVIAIGIGRLDAADCGVECVCSQQIEARRASNTKLLTCIDEALKECGVERDQLA